jgi:hypothetical protein
VHFEAAAKSGNLSIPQAMARVAVTFIACGIAGAFSKLGGWRALTCSHHCHQTTTGFDSKSAWQSTQAKAVTYCFYNILPQKNATR